MRPWRRSILTALKHLVLDVSVIIDLWLRPERAQAIEGLFAAPGDAGVCRWVSAASLPTLEFIAVRRFKEQGVDAERARTLVRRLSPSTFWRTGSPHRSRLRPGPWRWGGSGSAPHSPVSGRGCDDGPAGPTARPDWPMGASGSASPTWRGPVAPCPPPSTAPRATPATSRASPNQARRGRARGPRGAPVPSS